MTRAHPVRNRYRTCRSAGILPCRRSHTVRRQAAKNPLSLPRDPGFFRVMRILYIGTGAIGLPTLRSLLTDPAHEVCAVICQPDKPVGRRQVLTPPATKVLALEFGVPVYGSILLSHAIRWPS